MSRLRRTTPSQEPAPPYDISIWLIREAVKKRRGQGLIHGRLHDDDMHCGIGCYFADRPNCPLLNSLIDEVAEVNDFMGPKESPKKRWARLMEWLNWKIEVLGAP